MRRRPSGVRNSTGIMWYGMSIFDDPTYFFDSAPRLYDSSFRLTFHHSSRSMLSTPGIITLFRTCAGAPAGAPPRQQPP